MISPKKNENFRKEFNNLLRNLRQFIFLRKLRRGAQEFFHHREMEKVFPCHFSGAAADFSELFFGMLSSFHSFVSQEFLLHSLNELKLIFWHFGMHARRLASAKNKVCERNVFHKDFPLESRV